MDVDNTRPESATAALTVYWQPGCSSCLAVKEFLSRRGVPFVSVNVLADARGFAELASLGLRRVPIVRRGNAWADGQVLRDVARVARIRFDAPPLVPPAQLAAYADTVLRCTLDLVTAIPEERLDALMPDRPRSYRHIAGHVFIIVAAFLDMVEHGTRAEHAVYEHDTPEGVATRAQLVAYGERVRRRCADWWHRHGGATDFAAAANVYYGEPDVHEFFERTVWHAGQHARQLQWGVERMGLAPHGGMTAADLAGLPLPEGVL
jgi:glutaredoxin